MNDAGELDGWQDYAELKKMLVILGDVVRLNLVHALARLGEVNVTDLAQLLLVSQPLVSWHLSRLRRTGLVRTRRQGRQVYCSLDTERYQRCIHMLADVVAAGESAPQQSTPRSVAPSGGARDDLEALENGTEPGTGGSTGPRGGRRSGPRTRDGANRMLREDTQRGTRADDGHVGPTPRATQAEGTVLRSDVATTAGRPHSQTPL